MDPENKELNEVAFNINNVEGRQIFDEDGLLHNLASPIPVDWDQQHMAFLEARQADEKPE